LLKAWCLQGDGLIEGKSTGTPTAVSTTGITMEPSKAPSAEPEIYPKYDMDQQKTTLVIEQQTSETRSCNPCGNPEEQL